MIYDNYTEYLSDRFEESPYRWQQLTSVPLFAVAISMLSTGYFLSIVYTSQPIPTFAIGLAIAVSIVTGIVTMISMTFGSYIQYRNYNKQALREEVAQ